MDSRGRRICRISGARGGPCVTDYGTGKMINPDPAFFVPIVLDAVTGETDYRAYFLKVEADQAPSYFTPCQ